MKTRMPPARAFLLTLLGCSTGTLLGDLAAVVLVFWPHVWSPDAGVAFRFGLVPGLFLSVLCGCLVLAAKESVRNRSSRMCIAITTVVATCLAYVFAFG